MSRKTTPNHRSKRSRGTLSPRGKTSHSVPNSIFLGGEAADRPGPRRISKDRRTPYLRPFDPLLLLRAGDIEQNPGPTPTATPSITVTPPSPTPSTQPTTAIPPTPQPTPPPTNQPPTADSLPRQAPCQPFPTSTPTSHESPSPTESNAPPTPRGRCCVCNSTIREGAKRLSCTAPTCPNLCHKGSKCSGLGRTAQLQPWECPTHSPTHPSPP